VVEMITDIYGLLQHLRDEELKAHLAAANSKTEAMHLVFIAREKFARDLIDRIENSPNQRPHIK